MNRTIIPKPLQGIVDAIPSKSAAHRALICAALAEGETDISCPILSRDIQATADCLQALGAEIRYDRGHYHVRPITKIVEYARLDCGESGSTLRFLLPVVCALGCRAEIRMHGRLPQRPLSPLWEELIAHGAVLSRPESDLIAVDGKLRPGHYRIRANISSQFISGLLFALPLLKGESRIELEGTIESAGYIRMTQEAQRSFGMEIPFDGSTFFIPADCCGKSPGRAAIEGDWSNAAFWLVADALSEGTIQVKGLDASSAQGDRAVQEAIGKIRAGGAVIDARDIPDLVPVLAVLAAATEGETRFIHAARLRIKESDRLAAVSRMITALGGDCRELEDGLTLHGKRRLHGGVVDGENDHRIVMSAAVAALVCDEPVTITGVQAAEKSYPAFFDDYRALGGAFA